MDQLLLKVRNLLIFFSPLVSLSESVISAKCHENMFYSHFLIHMVFLKVVLL